MTPKEVALGEVELRKLLFLMTVFYLVIF